MIQIYGVPGYGSSISELMLTLAEIPYHFMNVHGYEKPGPQRDMLAKINPLCQVPTLSLEDGTIMTETAAIALMILDRQPQFAPPADSHQRNHFWRILVWMVANVYPTFTYTDNPERWTRDAPHQLRESVARHRETLYLWLEEQATNGPWFFGEHISLIDCYLPVLRHWSPGEVWFSRHVSKLNAIADAVCQRPELQTALRSNQLC